MPELNGTPVTPDDLRSLALTNYGHYTSMRADDQHIRGLSLHLDRLVRDCRLVFNADLDREKVRELIRRTTRDRRGSFVIRVTVFDPELEIGAPSAATHPHILVTTRPAVALPAVPIRVQTVTYRRDLPLIKHIGLFGALWHRRAAQLNGFDDALFTDEKSLVSEGATWNIGFFDGDQVVWPDAEALPGVTMRLLQQVHEQTITASINVAEIADLQAAFATNTTVSVRPIGAINDMTLPEGHPIFETLRKEYMEIPAERL
jgi:branched-subunit amino acid aminotransferase/4-amino-4-deoxychorismate lyase